MPELPEVETISNDLDEIVGRHIIKNVAVSFDKIVASDRVGFHGLLIGQTIEKVWRMGKMVRFDLAGPKGQSCLLAHLKMTGQFHMGPWPETSENWPTHARAAFRLDGFPEERDTFFYDDMRKFGRLRAFDPLELEIYLAELSQGPDPLKISETEFHSRLVAKKARLKGVLLDQKVVAGLGNIYVDEGLFAAGLSPLRSASSLTPKEAGLLLHELQFILQASIAARGSTTKNYQGLKGGGGFQKNHKIYGHAGEPCSRCGNPVEHLTVAGRGTSYCPHCQK